jgi:hypothetical protein
VLNTTYSVEGVLDGCDLCIFDVGFGQIASTTELELFHHDDGLECSDWSAQVGATLGGRLVRCFRAVRVASFGHSEMFLKPN